MPTKFTRRQALAIPAGFALGSLAPRAARADDPIKVGLVAALSGPSTKSGEGITRGLTIAIDDINARGGVLGRQIELVRRDDESNPAKGQSAARELIDKEGCVTLFGEKSHGCDLDAGGAALGPQARPTVFYTVARRAARAGKIIPRERVTKVTTRSRAAKNRVGPGRHPVVWVDRALYRRMDRQSAR